MAIPEMSLIFRFYNLMQRNECTHVLPFAYRLTHKNTHKVRRTKKTRDKGEGERERKRANEWNIDGCLVSLGLPAAIGTLSFWYLVFGILANSPISNYRRNQHFSLILSRSLIDIFPPDAMEMRLRCKKHRNVSSSVVVTVFGYLCVCVITRPIGQ